MQKIKKCSKLSWANEGVCCPNEISFWCLILVWTRVAEVKIADFWRPLKYLDLVHQPHISNFAKERSFFHIFYSAPQQHSRTALFFLVPYSLWNSGTADICRMLGQKNYICLDFVFQFNFFVVQHPPLPGLFWEHSRIAPFSWLRTFCGIAGLLTSACDNCAQRGCDRCLIDTIVMLIFNRHNLSSLYLSRVTSGWPLLG